MKIRFHHTAFRIRKGSLDAVERLFRHIGFTTSERAVTERDAAVWMGVEGAGVVVQFSEVQSTPPLAPPLEEGENRKTYSHIAFLDDDPRAATEALVRWCGEQGIVTRTGQWKDTEHWLDCPDLFHDFVLEIMHPSVAGEG